MKVIKSVGFNAANFEEKAMLEHFSRRSFSKYIKQLIREDIKRSKAEKALKSKEKETQPDVEISKPVEHTPVNPQTVPQPITWTPDSVSPVRKFNFK
ncbi:hypothetical protein [Alkalihalobacterium alkalinitrilicum]|uniref:hypothetical protein n=1 Tax=Alkalihalobacterium alkalinitrilicum TaxID=427920 RepID=UPI000994D36C|nr:hypothetical protein [Alkalihalobacterium alkalinitrilicum]